MVLKKVESTSILDRRGKKYFFLGQMLFILLSTKTRKPFFNQTLLIFSLFWVISNILVPCHNTLFLSFNFHPPSCLSFPWLSLLHFFPFCLHSFFPSSMAVIYSNISSWALSVSRGRYPSSSQPSLTRISDPVTLLTL